ncbi:hypothetical protein BKA80DRAFT_54972 [Phyllosticta citrichinensis]
MGSRSASPSPTKSEESPWQGRKQKQRKSSDSGSVTDLWLAALVVTWWKIGREPPGQSRLTMAKTPKDERKGMPTFPVDLACQAGQREQRFPNVRFPCSTVPWVWSRRGDSRMSGITKTTKDRTMDLEYRAPPWPDLIRQCTGTDTLRRASSWLLGGPCLRDRCTNSPSAL